MAAQIAYVGERDQHTELSAEQYDEAPVAHARNVASSSVHIIIPVLNEAAALAVLLPALPAELRARTIVVDNGSTDGSAVIAQNCGARVVAEPRRGYGAACLSGIAGIGPVPGEDIVLFMDGDASDDLSDIPALLDPIRRDIADLVIGSRVLGARERGALTAHARFGNWLATWLIFQKTKTRFTDLGPMRAIRADALRGLNMQDRAFGWTVEMQLKAVQYGLRVCEIPVRYRRRIGKSKISGTVSGSVRAGFAILRTIARHGG